MERSANPWHSYRLRRVERDDQTVVGWYGGHPRGIRAHVWPRCRICNSPMCHMAQLDAGPHLDLGGWARMSLFICHATGGRCEDWDPWKGANRVVLQRVKDDSLYDGPPTVRVYRRMQLTVDRAIDEQQLMAQVKNQGLALTDALEQLRHDKLGGGAVWLYGDDTPESPTDRGPMRMVLQLTTDLVTFDITSRGMAYVFLDPHDDSEDGARMLWQGG